MAKMSRRCRRCGAYLSKSKRIGARFCSDLHRVQSWREAKRNEKLSAWVEANR